MHRTDDLTALNAQQHHRARSRYETLYLGFIRPRAIEQIGLCRPPLSARVAPIAAVYQRGYYFSVAWFSFAKFDRVHHILPSFSRQGLGGRGEFGSTTRALRPVITNCRDLTFVTDEVPELRIFHDALERCDDAVHSHRAANRPHSVAVVDIPVD